MNRLSKPNRPKGGKPKGSALVSAPAAISRRQGSQKPKERFLANGNRCLSFKEYVQDIGGSVAFSATSFSVQPGLPTLFAWLASQAVSYQEYRFRKLNFVFETEKSSSSSGKLMMAFQPDAGDPVPASKQEMLENQFKAANAVWAPCQFSVPPGEALGARRYIRSGALDANLDVKTYDLGNLVVATQGCADTSAVGELYVQYEIELFTPVVSAAAVAKASSALITGAGGVSATAIFGSAATVAGGLSVTASGNTITFNRVGRYIVNLKIGGTGLYTIYGPATTAPSGGSVGPVVTNTAFSNAAANAGTVATVDYVVNVVTRGTTLVIDCDPVSTTVTASFCSIAPYYVA